MEIEKCRVGERATYFAFVSSRKTRRQSVLISKIGKSRVMVTALDEKQYWVDPMNLEPELKRPQGKEKR